MTVDVLLETHFTNEHFDIETSVSLRCSSTFRAPPSQDVLANLTRANEIDFTTFPKWTNGTPFLETRYPSKPTFAKLTSSPSANNKDLLKSPEPRKSQSVKTKLLSLKTEPFFVFILPQDDSGPRSRTPQRNTKSIPSLRLAFRGVR
jgi:hypothetical protein